MDEKAENTEKKESVWNHLQELLNRLKIILISIIIVSVFVMLIPSSIFPFFDGTDLNLTSSNISDNKYNYLYGTFTSSLLKKIEKDILPEGVSLIAGSWTSLLEVYFLLSIAIAIVVCFPIIIYEIYEFLKPALYRRERKFFIKFFTASILLFIFGIALAYLIILSITFKILMFFVNILGVLPLISIDNFVFLVVAMLLGTGFVFVSPVLLYFLIKAKILNYESVASKRKYIYASLLILIMILTPDPTIVSDVILSVPLILMFEIALYMGKRIAKR
ncbi:MAG: twin-arginine translocase subunit TatC [Candidatus Altarchaeum sp.]|nr:twin-arginine translocase subunit TatC [Candidatus Altarchaeum sp.]